MSLSCLICSGSVRSYLGFPKHLTTRHGMGTREYFDLFFLTGSTGLCLVCSGSTRFVNMSYGYREFCSHECADSSDLVKSRRIETNVAKYGVGNVFQSEEHKERSRQTLKSRYGVDHPMRAAEIVGRLTGTNLERYGTVWQITSSGTRARSRETMLSRYRVVNPFEFSGSQAKIRETNLERYGEEHPVNSFVSATYGVSCALNIPGKLDQARETCRERYGVDWAMQNPDVLKRHQESGFKRKTVSVGGREFSCQGWEYQFLKNCDLFGFSLDEISTDVPSVKYFDVLSSKWRRYIPDFISTDRKTVVEVKSAWTFDGYGKKPEWKLLTRCKMSGSLVEGYTFVVAVVSSDGFPVHVLRSLDELDAV